MGNQKNLLKNNEMLILLAQGLIVAVQLYLLFCIYRLIDVFWGVPLGFGVTSFLYFTIIKKGLKEKAKSAGLVVLKISLVIMTLTLVNIPLVKLSQFVDAGVPVFIFIMVSTITCVALVTVFTRKGVKDGLEKYLESDINIPSKKKDENHGDVVICKDAETGKPVILPYKDRFLHMLILGATGTGKTSQVLLPLIYQDMQNHQMGITVIEPKGDLAEKAYAMAEYFGRPALYFNPTLPDCPCFNPLYGREEDVLENMATTFKMLNPDSPQYFLDLNETLIRNSIKVLKRVENDPAGQAQKFLSNGISATLIDLSKLVHNAGGGGRTIVMAFSKIAGETEAINKENADIASWFLLDYFAEKSKIYENSSGLRSQVTNIISNPHLRRVLNPDSNETGINFDKHLAEGGVLCITTAQGALRDLGRYLGYFIILQLQAAVFKRPGTEFTRKPCSLYIDEFQVYSNPGFADMLTQGRSYRVASHLATQNRALMAMGGGRDGKNFVSLVSTNARNVILFPGGSYEDADYYAKQFGEVTKITKEVGITRKKFNPLYGFHKVGYASESIRNTEKKTLRFSPTDIIYRPFGEIIYSIVQNNSVQLPGVGKISYIDKEVNEVLDNMVRSYNSPIVYFEKSSTKDMDFEARQKQLDEEYKNKGSIFINDLDKKTEENSAKKESVPVEEPAKLDKQDPAPITERPKQQYSATGYTYEAVPDDPPGIAAAMDEAIRKEMAERPLDVGDAGEKKGLDSRRALIKRNLFAKHENDLY